jgi:hypothetical protein
LILFKYLKSWMPAFAGMTYYDTVSELRRAREDLGGTGSITKSGRMQWGWGKENPFPFLTKKT